MTQDQAPDQAGPAHAVDAHSAGATCEIFVNRRRFAISNQMVTAADIAALMGVPADNAVVERGDPSGDWVALPLAETLDIHPGDTFLVTRQFVMGGHG
ncbi:hypothetical protein UAJ10_06115 [Nitrospirillum sp. BR 11164]|uniref:hypothetical protein n=1 Tax=Nitrospirillum sp. BR 11164 TaxID=3104324 RepID=UPI002AFFCEF2|nr:hypothetical protein [Nitrospirillum sp. BR 11164]MEA1648587.1 hypothetical protein [Nitrospirillum sp. BR 11164]